MQDPKTLTPCRRCGCGRVSDRTWRTLTAEHRKALLARGIRCSDARGLCRTCYSWLRDNDPDALAEYPRASVSLDEVLEEWQHTGRGRALTEGERITALAPRLGMKRDALERAIQRAKAKGLLAVAA